ncbi:hypothetical protein FN846DRAFT_903954 [Sphaerosporella brunnea]|uniref:Plastocyanin-like domain-containing protein n=1 Tax=Sphaerosporella brunnea TaxID=1250544 RepID=A0A5J5F6E9_9PEZI|nr:hypothetical protein FN846DRAFT_903954 [Sphaerosporella brunnea]
MHLHGLFFGIILVILRALEGFLDFPLIHVMAIARSEHSLNGCDDGCHGDLVPHPIGGGHAKGWFRQPGIDMDLYANGPYSSGITDTGTATPASGFTATTIESSTITPDSTSSWDPSSWDSWIMASLKVASRPIEVSVTTVLLAVVAADSS